MPTNLCVRFSGLALLTGPPNVKVILAPEKWGGTRHDPRLSIPCDSVDWDANPTPSPDAVIGSPSGGNVAIWNLPAGTSVDLPGNTSPLDADFTRYVGKTHPTTPKERRSLYWIGGISLIQSGGGGAQPTALKPTSDSVGIPLNGGLLEPDRFPVDPVDPTKPLVYAFTTPLQKPTNHLQTLALEIKWTSADLHAGDEIKIVSGGAPRIIPLAVNGVRPIELAISNEPTSPCAENTGLLLDWLSLYDQLDPAVPRNDRVIPDLSPGPSLGSGFCPPGGYP